MKFPLRISSLLLVSALSWQPLSAADGSLGSEAPAAAAQAKAYCDAVRNHEYDKSVDFLGDSQIKKAGGREKVLAALHSPALAAVQFLQINFPNDPVLIPSTDAVIYRIDTDSIAQFGPTKIHGHAFLLLYHLNNDPKWFVLESSQTTAADLQALFRGVPADLTLAADKSEVIKD